MNPLLAIGQTFAILSGGIDLSVGSLLALVSVVCAQQMKAYIRKHIAMGWTKSQIVNSLVGPPNNLGPSVLGVPRKHGFDLLAWVLPLGGAAVGAVGLAFAARAWTRGRTPASANLAQAGLTPEDERAVDEALARFDG